MKEHGPDTRHDPDGGRDMLGNSPHDRTKLLEEQVCALRVANGGAVAWDDVIPAYLDPDQVTPARHLEMPFVKVIGVYERAPWSQHNRTRGKVIHTMLIDTHGGVSRIPFIVFGVWEKLYADIVMITRARHRRHLKH